MTREETVLYAWIAVVAILFLCISISILIFQNKTIMAAIEQFQAALDRIDAATNSVAQELKELKDVIAGGGLSTELEEQVLSRLQSAATSLESVGKEEPPTEPGADA